MHREIGNPEPIVFAMMLHIMDVIAYLDAVIDQDTKAKTCKEIVAFFGFPQTLKSLHDATISYRP